MSQTFERDSIHRRPLAFSILLIGAVAAVDLLIKATSDLLSLQLSVMTTGIVSGAVLSALSAFVIRRLGVWGELGLTARPARWRTLLWFLPFAIYGVLPLTQGLDATAGKVAGAVAFGGLIAFWKLACDEDPCRILNAREVALHSQPERYRAEHSIGRVARVRLAVRDGRTVERCGESEAHPIGLVRNPIGQTPPWVHYLFPTRSE